MARLAHEGAAEGTWLRAERQTAGRGRLGRAWVSSTGNLHASTLVRLTVGDPPPQTLALVAGIALHEALCVFASGLALRWPNDVMAGDAKVAGILLERRDDTVVVGFGANLASAPTLPDRRTVAVLELAGNAPAPDTVLHALAEAFARAVSDWRGRGLAAAIADWSARAHQPGAALALGLPDGEAVIGLFDGLDATGALRLRLASGETRVIHAADVAVIDR